MAVDGNFQFSYANNTESERANEAQMARGGKGGVNGSGGGWLMAIGTALGKIADSMGERMLDMAKQVDTLTKMQKDDPGATLNGKGLTELNTELQVLSQQLGQMLQISSSIIKTIGEGNKDISRKG